MNNRLIEHFKRKPEGNLSIFFTAGYPKLEATTQILEALQEEGVDLVEIGMPYSDPIADGSTIQATSLKAIANGMSIGLLLDQLKDIRTKVSMPIVLMGYFNPVLQYGVERFLSECSQIGIDGLILPDMPYNLFEKKYKALFQQYNISSINLITPQTSLERIRAIDAASDGFVYMVSSASVTGSALQSSKNQEAYFESVAKLGLKNPRLMGFGIHDQTTFSAACKVANGAIIGSAFLTAISKEEDYVAATRKFIQSILKD